MSVRELSNASSSLYFVDICNSLRTKLILYVSHLLRVQALTTINLFRNVQVGVD